MKYNLHTSKGILSFDYIEDFYNQDKIELRRCAAKLTNKHIYAEGMSSMKVSLVAQVFSNTVSAGMNVFFKAGLLKTSSLHTIEFVGKINNLFDSMNGVTKKPLHGKPFLCSLHDSSPNKSLWNELIKIFLSGNSFLNL